MKKLLLLLVFAFMAVMPMSASTADDIAYIRKFYTEYKSAYEHDKNSYPPEKCYEVIKKYCAESFFAQMKDNEVGYDFPTSDYGLDDLSLETLAINNKIGSDYLVTFKVHYSYPYKTEIVIKEITVLATMKNGKIDDITGVSEK